MASAPPPARRARRAGRRQHRRGAGTSCRKQHTEDRYGAASAWRDPHNAGWLQQFVEAYHFQSDRPACWRRWRRQAGSSVTSHAAPTRPRICQPASASSGGQRRLGHVEPADRAARMGPLVAAQTAGARGVAERRREQLRAATAARPIAARGRGRGRPRPARRPAPERAGARGLRLGQRAPVTSPTRDPLRPRRARAARGRRARTRSGRPGSRTSSWRQPAAATSASTAVGQRLRGVGEAEGARDDAVGSAEADRHGVEAGRAPAASAPRRRPACPAAGGIADEQGDRARRPGRGRGPGSPWTLPHRSSRAHARRRRAAPARPAARPARAPTIASGSG